MQVSPARILINVIIFVVDLDQIVEPLRVTCTTKVKANSVKQEFEKQDELKRSAMRAVAALLLIPDAGQYATKYVLSGHLLNSCKHLGSNFMISSKVNRSDK